MYFDLLNKDPLKFKRYHRYLSYGFLLLVFLVSLSTHGSTFSYFYTILFLIALPIIESEGLNSITRQYGYALTKNLILYLDAVAVAIFINSVDLAIVPSLVAVLSFIFAALWIRSSLLNVIAALLVGAFSFYLCIYLTGRKDVSFSASSIETSIISVVCFAVYLGLGLAYYDFRIHFLENQKKYAEEQVGKYLTLANKLARYAPSQVWQSIIRGEHEAKIDNKRKKLTIFFSDIQGFTELSERVLPDDLAFILNEYFEQMSEFARKYGGTVDKFMGDAILIFFGDPETKGVKEDAVACVDMAMAMRQHMKILRQRWKSMGYDGLHIRIGITTGYCHVGNFGTNSRMSYTIIGKDANLAARLQTAAEVDQILISDSTYQLIKDVYTCTPCGELILKGISEPVVSWQVESRTENKDVYDTRWLDYEFEGFNLQLNLNDLKLYESDKIIQALEQASKRLRNEVLDQKSKDQIFFKKVE